MSAEIVKLPANFIGKEDEARLESFGGFLIGHGAATRWHWHRSSDGLAVEFLIYHGGAAERLLGRIGRDGPGDAFFATDARGRQLARGHLETVMTRVNAFARRSGTEPSA